MPTQVDDSGCSGFSRRSFFRFAAGASALASMPILTEAHLALAQRPRTRSSRAISTNPRGSRETSPAATAAESQARRM